jgi:hypothetical protein
MVVAVLLAVMAGAVLVACLQHAKAQGWTAPMQTRRARRLPAPPPEDQPPPNLAPLIPSPRVIATEFERGLRELTLYLHVQRGD